MPDAMGRPIILGGSDLRRLFLAAAFLVALLGAARADFGEGLAAYERGAYGIAFQEWLPLAEEGDAEAQFFLGFLYAEGRGVRQDIAEATRLFRKSAEKGHADGQFALGTLFEKGVGVPQSHGEAARWYRKAAEQGLASAQNNLGLLYQKGSGVPRNYVKAHLWFGLSAQWYERASTLPLQERRRAVANRDAVAKLMTSAEIAKAERLARAWRPKSP